MDWYVSWLATQEHQQELIRLAAARRVTGTTRPRRGVRGILSRRARRAQLGHAVTTARAPMGCLA